MFKFTDNTITTEITKGVYLNLKAEYKWNSNTELDLKLSWEPYSLEGPYPASSLTTSFSSPLGELNINGTYIGNQTLENTYNTTLTDINPNVRNITITFKYVNGNALVDLTQDFNKLVILKPNRYDNNVVFNRDGLNEMIDYFKKYPVRLIEDSDQYGHIKTIHGIDQERHICVKGLAAGENELRITTNLLPGEQEGSTNKDGERVYLNLGSSDSEWNDLYLSNNAYVGETVKAKELNGLLTGSGIAIGEDANGQPVFQVDKDGNVSMNGNIVWGKTQFSALYHKGAFQEGEEDFTEALYYGYDPNEKYYRFNRAEARYVYIGDITDETKYQLYFEANNGLYRRAAKIYRVAPPKPMDNTAPESYPNEDEYSDETAPVWHKELNSKGEDWYMSMTFDGGQTWCSPTRINAKDGDAGKVSNEEVLNALMGIADDGLFNFPIINEDGSVKSRLGIKATALVSELATIGKLNMGLAAISGEAGFDGNIYNAGQGSTLSGGYITFPIPTPFEVTAMKGNAPFKQKVTVTLKDGTKQDWTVPEVINKKGWRGRMGYLRGNGNGITFNATKRNTAGMGIAVYTNATFEDFYDTSKVHVSANIESTKQNVFSKIHLVLSFLMLTDSGLGLMTAVNQYNPNDWVFLDLMDGGSFQLTEQDKEEYRKMYGKDIEIWPGMLEDGKGSFPHYQYRWWSGGNGEGKGICRIARLWLHEDNGGLYYTYTHNQEDYTLSLSPWNWNGVG